MKTLILLIAAFCLSSCDKGGVVKKEMETIHYEGHSYVYFINGQKGGIAHSGNCECFKAMRSPEQN